MTDTLLDVLIIGGGPAGLAVASGLARQMYTTLVFDNGVYRNARATHMHNVAGWDHQPPGDFRANVKQHLLNKYNTVQFEQATIKRVRKTDSGKFEAFDDKGRSWLGRKLVLATGTSDIFPAIPGYWECWGYGIYACLFCHGYEDRGLASSGILCIGHIGSASMAIAISRMARRFTERVVLYTNGNDELAAQLRAELQNDNSGRAGLVTVDNRQIERLRRGSGRESEVVVTFNDRSETTQGFLVHEPDGQASGPFAEQLSLEITPSGDIKTSPPFCEASVPGVFAVGDCGDPMKAVAPALGAGSLAAAGVSIQIGAELAQGEK